MTDKELKERLRSLNTIEPESGFASIENRLGRQLSAVPAMSKKRRLALGITGMAAVGAASAILLTLLPLQSGTSAPSSAPAAAPVSDASVPISATEEDTVYFNDGTLGTADTRLNIDFRAAAAEDWQKLVPAAVPHLEGFTTECHSLVTATTGEVLDGGHLSVRNAAGGWISVLIIPGEPLSCTPSVWEEGEKSLIGGTEMLLTKHDDHYYACFTKDGYGYSLEGEGFTEEQLLELLRQLA